MPTYEYVCDACGHEFEEFQSMTAPVLKKCPKCAKLKLQRKIGTGAGIIFKGGGFYETDYRSDSYKEAAKKDSGKADSGSGKSDSGSGAKTETAKTESAPAAKPAESKPAASAKAEKPAKSEKKK